METVYLVLIVSTALLLGNEFSIAFFIHPSLQRENHQGFIPAIQVFARFFGKIMPFWMIGTTILHLILVYFAWANLSNILFYILTAGVLWLIIDIFSVIAPVPVNSRVAKWDVSNLPENWETERKLWDIYNIIRVVLIITAFVFLLLAYKKY
jgi:uncharacterized membrane protein